MTPILLLQFILPLALVIWIGGAPTRNWLSFCVQVFATASILVAIKLWLTGLFQWHTWAVTRIIGVRLSGVTLPKRFSGHPPRYYRAQVFTGKRSMQIVPALP